MNSIDQKNIETFIRDLQWNRRFFDLGDHHLIDVKALQYRLLDLLHYYVGLHYVSSIYNKNQLWCICKLMWQLCNLLIEIRRRRKTPSKLISFNQFFTYIRQLGPKHIDKYDNIEIGDFIAYHTVKFHIKNWEREYDNDEEKEGPQMCERKRERSIRKLKKEIEQLFIEQHKNIDISDEQLKLLNIRIK